MKVLLVIKNCLYSSSIIVLILDGLKSTPKQLDSILLGTFVCTVVVAIILSIITAGIQGTPNNHLQERTMFRFEEKILQRNGYTIEVKEIKKGVWEVQDKFKTLLDMKGWIRQKRYIRELMALKFILESYNNAKQIALALPFGVQRHVLKNLSIKFTDIKERTYFYKIIQNEKVYKSIFMRIRLFWGLKGIGHSSADSNWKYYYMSLKDYYRFKLFDE